jgi:hypothetical protein
MTVTMIHCEESLSEMVPSNLKRRLLQRQSLASSLDAILRRKKMR